MPENAAPPGRGKQAAIIAAVLALVVVLLLVALMRTPSNPEPTHTTAVNSKRGPFDVLTSPPPANTPQTAPALNAPANVPAANVAAPAPKPEQSTANVPAPRPPKSFDPNALPPGHPRLSSADEKSQVSVQWLGGDCFYIQSPGSVAVVTDPFDPAAVGLPAPSTGAHFVTVSRDTPEHNDLSTVHAFQGAEKRVLKGEGAQQGDLQITPVPLGGGGYAYVIDAGGLRIAHLGGARGPLTPEQVKQLGTVDLLLLPVGDGSLAPRDAVRIAQAVDPRVVLPMAYSTNGMPDSARKLKPVDAFVGASPYPRTDRDTDVMLIAKADLPPKTEIWTLRYGH